jgi:hypothetical protein
LFDNIESYEQSKLQFKRFRFFLKQVLIVIEEVFEKYLYTKMLKLEAFFIGNQFMLSRIDEMHPNVQLMKKLINNNEIFATIECNIISDVFFEDDDTLHKRENLNALLKLHLSVKNDFQLL